MKKRLPPLNWLRSFEASARYLNFTQAAGELNLTQAAISQQVKGLEAQLGVALFKRLPRGLELTESGKAYLPAVHESIQRLAAVTDELFGQGRARLLTVRANLVFFTTWLAPRLGKFRELYPDVGLRFTSNIWIDEQDKEADLEIRYGKGNWQGFSSDRLTFDELFPVCSPEAARSINSVEHLAEHTLLHVIGYEEGWGYWFNQTGFDHLDTPSGLQFDTLISALEMAAAGQGLALGRTSLVNHMMAEGRLVAPLAERVTTDEAFHLATPLHQYIHPDAELFRNWLLAEAEADTR